MYTESMTERDNSYSNNESIPPEVLKRARYIQKNTDASFKEALDVSSRIETAWENRTHSDPNEPVRFIASGMLSKQDDNS